MEHDLIDKIFIYEILFTNIIIYLHGLFLIFVIGIIANVQVDIYFLLSLFGFFLILINLIFLMNLIMILKKGDQVINLIILGFMRIGLLVELEESLSIEILR